MQGEKTKNTPKKGATFENSQRSLESNEESQWVRPNFGPAILKTAEKTTSYGMIQAFFGWFWEDFTICPPWCSRCSSPVLDVSEGLQALESFQGSFPLKLTNSSHLKPIPFFRCYVSERVNLLILVWTKIRPPKTSWWVFVARNLFRLRCLHALDWWWADRFKEISGIWFDHWSWSLGCSSLFLGLPK